MIQVTKPFLPPKEDFLYYVDKIYSKGWITNNGPLINELELQLKDYLQLDHILVLANGTLALQLAIRALELKGEVITTPFSYVATTSSIVWEGLRPVFVDIDPYTFNIDANKIEEAISDRTSAILATHVYGNPCDVGAIQKVADQNNLKVIYDASHAFGTKLNGKSILQYGDISTISFHATKLFHTVEGGAVVSQNPDLIKKMSFQRNFGHNGPYDFEGVGINAKNSEFHAAMGLANLKYMDYLINKRQQLTKYYDQQLAELRAGKVYIPEGIEYNYAYYPLLFKSEEILDKQLEVLTQNWVYPRRYFYPPLHKLSYVDEFDVPVTDDIAKRVLCLPLYHDLTLEDVDFIARLMVRTKKYS